MRTPFLTLGLIALAFPLYAGQLSRQERERAAAELRSTRSAFLKAIAGLSAAQWNFKPAPDRWSVAECAEHIALAEDHYFSLIQKKLMQSPAAPEKKAEAAGKDDVVLKSMPDRSSKRVAPASLTPTGRWKTREGVIAHFNASRDRLIRYVETTGDDLRQHFQAHRATGVIDGYQWILLASGHSARHTLQINEVKADPGFPRE